MSTTALERTAACTISVRTTALLFSVLVACSTTEPGLEGEPSAAVMDPPVAHGAFGLPGPWWQPGGSAERFETDVSVCRRESTAARERAGEPDPRDAAYRAFLNCMASRKWTRGRPSRSPR